MKIKDSVNGDKIVKCACGLPMRQSNWSDHWRSCKIASSVEVTQCDISNLLNSEERKRKSVEEHNAWVKSRNKSLTNL